MVEDVVRALGFAALGSRLKRIGELLQAQTQDLAAEFGGARLPSPHHPVLAALDRCGPLTVGELARALGQSQPGVTRMINKLKVNGFVEARSVAGDKRLSRLSLTENGAALVAHLKTTLWPAAHLAVEDACTGLSGPLQEQLAQLEDALADRPLCKRPDKGKERTWANIEQGKATQ